MLPLIVIGATDRVTEILTPFAEVGHISYHPTAEAANHALVDAFMDESLPEPTAQMTDRLGWRCHVAYGPKAYGDLCAARAGAGTLAEAKLPHSGHTLILGLDVHEPKRSIRAVAGEPAEEPEQTMIWQAAVNARADLIVDLESTDAVTHLVGYLAWKSVPA